MKNITILLLFSLMTVSAWAQNPDAARRDIPVKIYDKKGRPVKSVAVESFDTSKKGATDKDGQYVFKNMSDNDTISMNLPKYGKAIFPVTGMDSIVVNLRSATVYDYKNKERQTMSVEKEKVNPNPVLDVPEILKKQSYTSLISLLRGRVAGLNFTQTATGESASIRGNSSFDTNNEPLVALDGIIIGTVSEANAIVNVHDIKTIEVLKLATEYGVRGSNGVIKITSKRNSN